MQMLTNPVDIFHNSISPSPTIKPKQHAHKATPKVFGTEKSLGAGTEVQTHSKTIFITY